MGIRNYGGDNKAFTVGKSADCTVPLKNRDTLIEQSETLVAQLFTLIKQSH